MKTGVKFKKILRKALPLALALVVATGLLPEFSFSVVKADSDYNEEIEALLSQGKYEENCAIAVVRKDTPAMPMLFSAFSATTATSLLNSAETLMTMSEDVVEEALKEDITNSKSGTEQTPTPPKVQGSLSASNDSSAQNIEIVKITSDTLSTSEILYALAEDESVICAEPNYIYNLDEETNNLDLENLNQENSTPENTEGPSAEGNEGETLENHEGETQENKEGETQENKEGETLENHEGETQESNEGITPAPETTTSGNGISQTITTLQDNSFGDALQVTDTYESYDLTSLQWGYLSDYSGTFRRDTANLESTSNYVTMGIEGWNGFEENATGVVAVMDTGVDYTNPDLANIMVDDAYERTGEGGTMGINAADPENADDPSDTVGHGTHCAGIIGAEWNGYGTSGAANGVKILAVKIEKDGSLTADATVKGFDYLVRYAESATCKEDSLVAVNNSWGAALAGNTILNILCTRLGKAGVVMIFSSGNSNYDNDIHSSTPSLLAENPYVIKVNAADFDGTKAYYSSYGLMSSNVYGAGTEILSTYAGEDSICPIADTNPIYRNYFAKEDYTSNLVVAKVEYDESGAVIYPDELSDFVQADDVTVDKGSSLDEGTYSLKFGTGSKSYWLGIPVKKDDLDDIAYLSAITYGAEACPVIIVSPVLTAECKEVRAGALYGTFGWCNNSVCLSDVYTEGNTQYSIKIDDDTELALFMIKTDRNADYPIYVDCLSLNSKESIDGAAGDYTLSDGTSMAAPSVSGCAAIAAKRFAEYGTEEAAIMLADYLKAHVVTNENFLGTCSQGGMVNMSVEEENTVPVLRSTEQEGNIITINGSYFGDEMGQIFVEGSQVDASDITSWSDTQIVFEYEGATQGEITIDVTKSASGKTGSIKMIYAPGQQQLFTDLATPTSVESVQTGFFSTSIDLGTASLAGLGDYIYAVLSEKYAGSYKSLFRYSIKEDTWSIVSAFEGMMNSSSCSITAYEGKIYVYANDGDAVGLFAYDPDTDTVETINTSEIEKTEERCSLFVNATLFNADNQLMLIGGKSGDGDPYLTDNVAEIYINDNVLTYNIVGTIALEGTEGKDYLGVVSPHVTEYNGEIYVGCFSSMMKQSYGGYTVNIPCKLFKLTYSDGAYVTTDVTQMLPELITTSDYTTSNGYLPVYGLASCCSGILISGANIESEDGTRSIADTCILTEPITYFDYSADLSTIFFPASITYGGKLYTLGTSRYGTNDDLIVFRSLDIDSYQVNFDNGGIGNQPFNQQIAGGDKVAAPDALTAVGYVFCGWYKEAACINKWDFENDTVNADMTLYAKWEEASENIIVNKPDDKILTDMEAAEKILDAFSKKYKNENASLKINIENSCSDVDKKQIEKYASKKDGKIYYNVTLLYRKQNGEYVDIGDENSELLSITYDFSYGNKTDIQVLRIHNNKVDELKETKNAMGEFFKMDKKNGKLTICAGQYSTYAIVYNVSVPNTGDTTNLTVWIIVGAAALVIIILLIIFALKRKKK